MKTKTYSLTHKGQRLATCKFSVRKRAWQITSTLTSEIESHPASTDIEPIWKALKERIQDELGVTVKRGRPKTAKARLKAPVASTEAQEMACAM